MSWPRSEINAGLPVTVAELEYSDPILTIFGMEWSLSLRCPWSGVIASRQVSWEDDYVEDRAWDLIGTNLITVEDGVAGEIKFRFSNAILHVHADTDIDPWVLRLPRLIAIGQML